MIKKSHKFRKIVTGILFGFAFFWGVVFGLSHVQNLNDWMILRNFSPSAEVAKIPAATGMNQKGEELFFVAQPEIVDAAKFQRECPNYERAVVLGCYLPANQRIFLFDVQDERIENVKSVTAAHEMLHVAFSRLSAKEKQQVGDLIRDVYVKIDDADLESRMELYETNEPGAEIEELFCILGTEFDNLGDELEKFYERYFSEREKVVALNASYKKVFADLMEKRENLAADLKNEKSTIELETASYRAGIADLSAAIDDFNNCAAKVGCFLSQEKFSERRAELISQRDFLDQQRKSINSRVENYNNSIDDLRALGVEIEDLQESLSASSELEI